MKKIVILFIILIIVSCVHNNRQIIDNEYYYNGVEGIDYVILPYDPITDKWSVLAFREGTPAGITTIDLENINELLQSAVEKYNNELKKAWEKNIELSKYNRQYIAIINENGEKEVFVNCFRAGVRDYWKNHFVYVSDGGNAYFQVGINLTTLKIYRFSVNGYA